jgi:hypothetical protein
MKFEPYFTFYTPTFRRPQSLARCMASVAEQTIVDKVEQIVIPDHVGLGVGGMYKRVSLYANAVHGRYVHILADDDVLVSPLVCEQVREFAVSNCEPEMVIVNSKKGDTYPKGAPWPPVIGRFDLGCMVVRNDVWRRHVQAYGHPGRYEGDFDFAIAVWAAGHKAEYLDLLFVEGAVSRGAKEVCA